MEVTITQFRRQIFQLVNQAMDGTEVWVTHKGRRFKITPDTKPVSKLDRLTPCDFINFDVPDPEKDGSLLKEMTEAWEKDWEEFDRLP